MNPIREYLPIGGKREYLLHFPCENPDGPVVLYLHGGPGMAASGYAHGFLGDLQKSCTLVFWDQPGAGKTLAENPDDFPTMERLLRELFIIVSCLKIKYGKQKIILLGHSFGSVLACLYAMGHPHDLLACIGAGQVTGIRESEQAALQLLREAITAAGSTKDLQKLEKLEPYPDREPEDTLKKLPKVRKLQEKYGFGQDFAHALQVIQEGSDFHHSDMSMLTRGLKKNSRLWEFLLNHNMNMEMRPYKMPVYFILGKNDHQAPPEPALQYLERLRAPAKKSYVMEHSGHFMMLDAPEEFRRILTEILSEITQ